MICEAALIYRALLCCCIALGVLADGKEVTSATVTDAASLGAALKRDNVDTINIRGKIRLSKQSWVPEGTVSIGKGRHVILQADEPDGAQAVLDMGTLVDAIHVGNGSHLELRRLRIPNCASRHVHASPPPRVRLRVAGIFALWPSITLAINSSMSFSDSVFYYWSDKEWDSCDKFRSAATGVLNPKGYPNMLEWSGSDTTVFIKGTQNTSQALIDTVKNKTYVGAFNTTRTNHTLVCLPDPFSDEAEGFPMMTVVGLLSTIAIAAGIAQYMGFIELRPGVVAAVHGSSRGNSVPILGSNGKIIGYGSRNSLGSGGPHHTHPSAVEHLSGMLRERQKALLGGLELGELLGRGSFGKVYKGRWRGAMVAVKIVTHDRTLATLAETLRESALSTSIQHPNVVTTFKVRTIRSQGGSTDQASASRTWTTAEDGSLDAAAGGHDQLLARVMSIAGGVSNPSAAKPKMNRTVSGNLEFTPGVGPGAHSGAYSGTDPRGATRSLPHQPHDSAASSACMSPPHPGYVSQSLPSSRQSAAPGKDSGPLGASSSLLQQSSRGSARNSTSGPSRNASEQNGAAPSSGSDAAQQAARAFAEAQPKMAEEPLSLAMQMQAAAAIAAELPKAEGDTADTLQAKLQSFSANAQVRRSPESAPPSMQGPSADGEDDRVPLEALTRPTGRESRSSAEFPAAAPKDGLMPAAQNIPHPNTADDQPQPLSLSVKGSLGARQLPMYRQQNEPDQAASDPALHADEPEPLGLSMNRGLFKPEVDAPAHDDSKEPEAMMSRRPPPRVLESPVLEQTEDADAPEPLMMRQRSSLRRQASQAGGASLDWGQGTAETEAGSSGRAVNMSQHYAGLLGAAGDGMQPPASGFSNDNPGLPGPGFLAQAEQPCRPSSAHEPELLGASLRSSSGNQTRSNLQLGTPPKPPGRPAPHRRTSSIGIPRTLSAIAARVPGFGRHSPSALPSTPEDGPGLLGSSESPKPDVPLALLTNHSTGANGSAAAQMANAAADPGPDLLETWLILEYCDQGSFDHAIRTGKFTNDLGAGVLCLMDIAAGMEHLHSLGVLHADLKGANVLLKSSALSNYDKRGYTCKLADFGLSRVMEHNSTHISTSTFGTAAYMPAELLMEGKMTKAADVYSFAMLMHELLTGQQLFEGMRQSQIICKVITGWRPEIPEGSPHAFVDLMCACWHPKLEQRPKFADILLQLRGIYKELRMAAG